MHGFSLIVSCSTIMPVRCTCNIYSVHYIHAGLQVSIRTDPLSQPYPAAIWIHFACHVENAIGTVFHNWTAFCSRFSPPLIVGRIDDNENNHGEFTLRVRSTPPSCLDTLVCNANDSTGQTGNATWHAGAITGVYCMYIMEGLKVLYIYTGTIYKGHFITLPSM